MSIVNRVIKNTVYLYSRMAVSIVFSFFTTRILLQALGVSDYGLYNVIAGSLAMLGFLSASMSSTTQRFISYVEGEGDLDKIKEIFNNSVFLHNRIALIVVLLFTLGGFVFFNGLLNIPEGRMYVAIAVYVCMIISTTYSIIIVPYDAILNAHENMKYYSILGILDVLAKFIIALLVLYCQCLDQLLLYGLLMAFEARIYQLLTKRYCIANYNEVRELKKKYVNKSILKKMTFFAGWNMLNISTGMICLYGMNIAINHFFGTKLNAAMGIASQLAGVMMGVSTNMTKALTPVLVKSEGGHERDKMIQLSLIGCKYSYLLFSFFSIPVIFCLKPLLVFWLKDVPEWTDLFCLLLLISTLIEQLFVFLYHSINAQGEVKNYNIVRSILNILPIIIMTIEFSLGFPPYYALINWILFKAIFGGGINLLFANKNFSFPLFKFVIDVLFPCLLATLSTGFICYLIRPGDSDTTFLVFTRLVSMLLLSLPIYWSFAFSKDERNMFKNFAKAFKNRI